MRDTARPSHEPRSVSLNLAIHHPILKAANVQRCPFWYRFGNSTFFYVGKMKPTDPTSAIVIPSVVEGPLRYLVVFNLYKKDCIRLVFPSGAKVKNTSGLLEGDYADGRRLAMFYSPEDVRAKTKSLQAIITKWLKLLEK